MDALELSEINAYPIKELLRRLANRLPQRKRYYVVLYYAGDPSQTIIANNLAEAYLLFYDYGNLINSPRDRNKYKIMQVEWNAAQEEEDLEDDEITPEWLERFNEND